MSFKHLFPYATDRQKEILSQIELSKSVRAAARALGTNESSLRSSLERLKKRAALQGISPEHGMTKAVPDGFVVKGISSLYNAEGALVGQWVKSKSDDSKAIETIKEFVEDLAQNAKGKSPAIAPPSHTSKDLLCVYPMGDPHVGMYAWKDETGADFDTEIAERLLCSAIQRLVNAAPPADTAIILPLGDYFHADDSTSKTPNSGNALDTDTRWAKVMQAGLRAMIYCVKAALAKHRNVIVRIVKGNHDSHSSFALALAVDAYFSNNKRVSVDLNPAPMWYFKFGRVLLGSTHGDTVKLTDLPSIMAFDKAQEWGQTAHRYWYLGHVHHTAVREFPGVVVEQFRTLAARDAWHAGQGYRAGRDMCLIVHHRDHGEIERHRCDIGQLSTS